MNIKVPSDIDVADRILWGLTARQLVILGATCLCCWSLYLSFARVPYVVAPIAGVIAAAGIGIAFARPDGLMAEQWLLAGLRHLFTPRRRVLAPEGLPAVPRWAKGREPIAAIEIPLQSVNRAGILSLGGGTFSLVCRASALNLSLRSDAERQGLIEGLSRFLNSIEQSLSFVVRSERTDVRSHIDRIERDSGALPHPALERAARSYADYLQSLAERRDVLRREVYVVFTTRTDDEDDASARLQGRAEEAGGLLRGLGIRLTPLDSDEVSGLIARACDPAGQQVISDLAPSEVVAGVTS